MFTEAVSGAFGALEGEPDNVNENDGNDFKSAAVSQVKWWRQSSLASSFSGRRRDIVAVDNLNLARRIYSRLSPRVRLTYYYTVLPTFLSKPLRPSVRPPDLLPAPTAFFLKLLLGRVGCRLCRCRSRLRDYAGFDVGRLKRK